MTRTLILGIAATIVAAPSGAFADTPAGNQQAQNTSDAREIVCRRMPPPAGTRIGPRNICRTQAEWDLLQQQNREEVERQQDASHYSRGN